MKSYPKLPKRFKAKWVSALRSGKYEQGNGWLYDCGQHCCLGVAGRVCGLPSEKLHRMAAFVGSDDFEKVIPKPLLGGATSNTLTRSLMHKNDSGKWSFKRIATWIEKYL